jgi:anaerobic ribonucleoside-triphosphate reductase
MPNDNDFLDDIEANEETTEQEVELESRELAYKQALEQVQRNLVARKRIDDLLEKKRLKELLDDSDDW